MLKIRAFRVFCVYGEIIMRLERKNFVLISHIRARLFQKRKGNPLMGKRVSIADTLFFVEILIRCQNIRLTLLAAEVCSVRLRLFYLYPDIGVNRYPKSFLGIHGPDVRIFLKYQIPYQSAYLRGCAITVYP